MQHKNTDNTPIIMEVIFSLFGIYGIGWLTTKRGVGIALLLSSIGYWFLTILFVEITWGLGIFCIAPFNIVLVVINASLLYTVLRRHGGRTPLDRRSRLLDKWGERN